MSKDDSSNRYETARSANQQLTFDESEAYFKKKNVGFGDEQKQTLNLKNRSGAYTNLALLISDQCTCMIKLGVFEGTDSPTLKERHGFKGSILKQLEDVYAFIDRCNGTTAVYQGLDRVGKRDYPDVAIRESLLNAIVHRAYDLIPSTLISIFDDRMEIITIGGLMSGVALGDIMLGVSALRNPNLAELFTRLKLIEAHGTGMQRIFESYQGLSVKPGIVYSDNAFKITLPNTNHYSNKENTKNSLNEREIKVISLLESSPSITRKDIEQALEISQATAIILLREMTEKRLLIKTGQGKNVKYTK